MGMGDIKQRQLCNCAEFGYKGGVLYELFASIENQHS
eukprot:COSAG02_NODE_187_length_30377_cov_3.636271_37_plen_37_part_00